MESGKINSFADLDAWKYRHSLVLKIYDVTRGFPKEEIYGLVSQMRRCAVSITSNIAEGFARQSYKEKTQFYSMANSSLTELQNQLLISNDAGFLSNEVFNELTSLSVRTHKIINGLIKSLKGKFARIEPPYSRFQLPNSRI